MLRICFFILLGLSMLFGCKAKQKLIESEKDKNYLFPLEWIGLYQGDLLIFNESKDTTKVKMQLSIGSPNAEGYYPWTIKYGEDDLRAYGLEVINADKGHYLIDEFNSIKLDSYLRDNHFISHFNVMDSDLLVDYERVHDGIIVNLYFSQAQAVSLTGSEIIGKDTIPEVKSFKVPVFQKAYLKLQ